MDTQLQIEQWHRQALEAVNRGQYEKAASFSEKILRLHPKFADAWFLRAMAAAGNLRIKPAIADLAKALHFDPRNAEYLAQMAKMLTLANANAKALETASLALELDPQSALTLDTLGVVLSKLGNHEKASLALKKAVEQQPENAQFQFNLASALQFIGDKSAAEKHYRKAIALKPGFARAIWALSELKKNTASSEGSESLEALVKELDVDSGEQLYIAHALARNYESEGLFEQAFSLLEEAKFRYRAQFNYSWIVDQRLFNKIKSCVSEERSLRSSAAPSEGKEAIFVVGMPRSGTTLCEQILGAHSKIDALGELQDFSTQLKIHAGTKSLSSLDAELIERSLYTDLNAVGIDYLKAIQYRRQSKRLFVDKLPHNFLYIAHILSALPAAKIILVRRNPMDTCLANFRQLFALHNRYYNYHYSIDDLAHYYVLFDDLMQHWQRLFGDRILTLHYEDLIHDAEAELIRLLDFCGVEFETSCLNFHQQKTAVSTASTMQVRQPIYADAIGRWQRYADQLEPAAEILASYDIDTGVRHES